MGTLVVTQIIWLVNTNKIGLGIKVLYLTQSYFSQLRLVSKLSELVQIWLVN